MSLVDKIQHFFNSLVSPYRYHSEVGENFLSISDSVMLSWVFAIINGIFRILLINLVLLTLSAYAIGPEATASLLDKDANLGYYFLILSSVLDIIFFPLFTLFIIQFWTFLIRSFARLVKAEGDLDLKVEKVVVGSLSSNIFMAIPIFGSIIQKVSSLVLLFIGMRAELKFSGALSICVLLTPVFIILILFMTVGLASIV